MKKLRIRTMTLLLILLVSARFGPAQTLKVGMPAPELKVGKWVKGKSINKFEPGQIYVVEFWATWCKPCIQAIPSMTKYAEKYKGKVKVIGISVNEQNTANVAPFVKKMGSQMEYHVAIDHQTSPTAKEGFMSKNWLAAAKASGIPFTAIVGKTGLIEYMGGSNLRSVLPQIISGTWAVISDDEWLKSPLGAKRKEIEGLLGDYEVAISELDAYAKMPGSGRDLYPKAWALAQKALVQMWNGKSDEYHSTIREMFNYYQVIPEGYIGWASGDRAAVFNNVIVWNIVDPKPQDFVKVKLTKKDYEFALKVAKQVVDLNPDEAGYLDSRAWAYYQVGDYENAKKDFLKVLEMAPSNKEFQKNYELFKSKIKNQ